MSRIELSEGLVVSTIIYSLLVNNSKLNEFLEENSEYVMVFSMQNAREQGYSYYLSNGKDSSFTWCTYQHRNSDNITINGKKGMHVASGELPYKSDDKYDVLYSFNAKEYQQAADTLAEEFINFIQAKNMSSEKNQTVKEKYNLDDSYELVYVDCNEYFEDAKDVERIVQEGNTDFVLEDSCWHWEAQYESIQYILQELEEEHGEISDEDREEITLYLEEHDYSDPAKQLMNNTRSGYFYYSLGHEIENHDGHACCEEGCVESVVFEIMKILKTENLETRKSVEEVVCNAGYGGDLVILFEEEIQNLLEKGEVIEFGPKAEICIMDRGMGSGHSEPLHTGIVVDFNRENLHCDEGAPGYSFTGEVCGMTKGFMDGCTIRNRKPGENVIKVEINENEQFRIEREKEYDRKWKEEGKCTFGDMKITRHRDTYYKNEYPCGTHCPNCSTFWID